MIPRSVKAPTIPIPFQKLLKVVAIVDGEEHIPGNCWTISLPRNSRSRSATISTATYPTMPRSAPTSRLIDGDRLEKARNLARSVRANGFGIPLWALANSHQISDMAVLGITGEVTGYIYLGQQTPAFYAKQVIASIVEYGMGLLPPFFGGLVAYDVEANIAFDCPGHQGGQFYSEVSYRSAVLQAFRRRHLPQRPVQRRCRPWRSAHS